MNLQQQFEHALRCLKQGDIDTAERIFRHILQLRPKTPRVLFLLGMTAFRRNRFSESIEYFHQAIQHDPNHAESHYNLGVALKYTKKPSEAVSAFSRTLALNKDAAEARWNRALCWLIAENLEKGLPALDKALELRNELGLTPRKKFSQPRWTGEPLNGKRLFVYTEQGLGDTIQFVRFLPFIKEKHETEVIFECRKSLYELMKSCPGYDTILQSNPDTEKPDISFDVQVPLLSLPHIFRTTRSTIPAPVPYITAPQERVEARQPEIARKKGRKVGLIWSGNPLPRSARHRHLAFSEFAPFASLDGTSFIGLQQLKDAGEPPRPPRGMDFVNFDENLTETAAIIMNLDLVISVDTCIAHLAGALGKPVWLLLSWNNDWRWFLDRTDTPWYPSMRLFRQPAPGDWQSVIRDVNEALREQNKSEKM